MKCPVCRDVTLLMTNRSGVEIDYCPECRGVWLDRGELDKIIEKEESYNKEDVRLKDYYDNEDNKEKNKQPRKKRESFVGEIFDLFGGD